jgi:hypothetical protein
MQTKQKDSKEAVEEQTVYTFLQEGGRWYIYLAAYLNQGWGKQDLELVEGAQKVLNTLSNGAKKLRLNLSLEPFEGANVLELVEHCPAPKGGGIYLYNPSAEHNSNLYWICDLALFVFGDIPERIYVNRLPLKEKEVPEGREATGYPHREKGRVWLRKAV